MILVSNYIYRRIFMNTNWTYKVCALASILLILVACNKHEEIASRPTTLQFSASGSLVQPEWVDLESNTNDSRAFMLKPNNREYPKIDLPVVQNNGFEPFVSVVWLFSKNNRNSTGLRIYVEDNNDPNKKDSHADDNTSNTSIPNNGKGISRIIMKDGKYRVLIGFNVPRGHTTRKKSNSMIGTFLPQEQYNVFVALNPPIRRDSETTSIHRIHFPITHNVEGRDLTEEGIPKLPPLKYVQNGQSYIVGQSATDMSQIRQPDDTGYNPNTFNMPFFSRFGETLTTENRNGSLTHGAAITAQFRMAGVLLALKFKNNTGRKIKVKKIKTQSSHLAYSGYYELWHKIAGKRYTNEKNSTFDNVAGVPFFSRSVREDRSDFLRGSTYEFSLQDVSNKPLAVGIEPRQSANGRVFLWGAIDMDESHTGPKETRCQVIYEYEDEPGVSYISKMIKLHERRGGGTVNFEDGKAYLITVPIEHRRRLPNN